MKRKTSNIIPAKNIEDHIFIIRGQKVIFDSDLAGLYAVPTKRLNEQVKRNHERFPKDFMFQLSKTEAQEWFRSRSQNATLKRGKNTKYLPYVFTEHGALMVANVLNSARAVKMSVYIIRTFIRLRETLAANQILEGRLAEIERVLLDHDQTLKDLFEKIRPLLFPEKKDVIGFNLTTRRIGKIGSLKMIRRNPLPGNNELNQSLA